MCLFGSLLYRYFLGQLNNAITIKANSIVISGGLFTPKCRSPPFLFSKKQNREHKKEDNTMAKEYYIYVKGNAIPVSEEAYKAYWKITEHEKYLYMIDREHCVLPFSSFDYDGHYADNIVDESVDVEKIVETQMMIEAVRNAISRLNAEERDIIERLYFNDETVRSVAKLKSITHPALIKRRNKILEKLKKFIEEL